MKRWTACFVAAAILQTASPAWAGGGSTFEFGRRFDRAPEFIAVGRNVVGRMDLAFDHIREPALGPFYAFLRPYSTHWRSPPRISNGALLLGRIDIDDVKPGKWTYATARLEFTVPDIEPGRYLIEYCNDPCTYALGQDDGNWPTLVVVTRTGTEARLRTRLSNTKARFESKMYRTKNVAARARARADRALRDFEMADSRITALQDRLEVIESRAAPTRSSTSVPWGWIALAAAGTLFAFRVAKTATHKAKTVSPRERSSRSRGPARFPPSPPPGAPPT